MVKMKESDVEYTVLWNAFHSSNQSKDLMKAIAMYPNILKSPIIEEDTDAIIKLLQLGVVRVCGTTPLIYALEHCRVNAASAMLTYGVDVNECVQGVYPICHTLYLNELELLHEFVDHGAILNVRTQFGLTLLEYAVTYCPISFTEYLLQHNCSRDSIIAYLICQRRDNRSVTLLRTLLRYNCIMPPTIHEAYVHQRHDLIPVLRNAGCRLYT